MFDNCYTSVVMPEDLDRNGCAKITAIYKKVIDAISVNIKKEGYGVDVLWSRGLTWVLVKCALQFESRPVLYERTEIKIWKGKDDGLFHDRYVEISSQDSGRFCYGTTQWCIIDRQTRKPVILTIDSSLQSGDAPCSTPRRLKPFTSDIKHSSRAGYSDCDFNGHLNNCRYLEFFFNLLPDKLLSMLAPSRLDVNFKSEVPCGADISASVKETGSSQYDFCMYQDSSLACCASFAVL